MDRGRAKPFIVLGEIALLLLLQCLLCCETNGKRHTLKLGCSQSGLELKCHLKNDAQNWFSEADASCL